MLNQGVFMLQQSSLYGGLREGLDNKAPEPPKQEQKKPEQKKTEQKKPEQKKSEPKASAPAPAQPAAKPATKSSGFQNMSPATYHN